MKLKIISSMILTAAIAIPAIASSQVKQIPSVAVSLYANGQTKLVNLHTLYEKTEQLKVLVYANQNNGIKAFADFYQDFNSTSVRSRLVGSSQTENFEHVVIVPVLTPDILCLMQTYRPEQGFSVVVDHDTVKNLLPQTNKGGVLRFSSGRYLEDKFD